MRICRLEEELGPFLLELNLRHSYHLEAPIDDFHDWMCLFGVLLWDCQFERGRRWLCYLHFQTSLVIHLKTLLVMVDNFLVTPSLKPVLDHLPAGAKLFVKLDQQEILLGRPGSLRANSRVHLVLPSLPALVRAASLKVNGYLLPRTAPLVGAVLNDKFFEPLILLWSPLLVLLRDHFLG